MSKLSKGKFWRDITSWVFLWQMPCFVSVYAFMFGKNWSLYWNGEFLAPHQRFEGNWPCPSDSSTSTTPFFCPQCWWRIVCIAVILIIWRINWEEKCVVTTIWWLCQINFFVCSIFHSVGKNFKVCHPKSLASLCRCGIGCSSMCIK